MTFLRKAYNTAKHIGKKVYNDVGAGIKKVREIAQDVHAMSPLLIELLNDASDLVPGVEPIKKIVKYGAMGLDSIGSFAKKVDTHLADKQDKHEKLGEKARKMAGNRNFKSIDKLLSHR